jgi:hypothetical protein
MRTRHLAAVLALLSILSPQTVLAEAPVVNNLTAAQRPGTKLVDIRYDVTADTSTVKVTLQISGDGGTTFAVPATNVTGDVGAGIAVGTGKTMVWNADADWLDQFSDKMCFQVTADDLLSEGFALIPAGEFQMGNARSASGDGRLASGFTMPAWHWCSSHGPE